METHLSNTQLNISGGKENDSMVILDFRPPIETVTIKNVYVIGSMGSGKSTLLNYLCNLNKFELFKTGRTAGSVTKKVQIEPLYVYDQKQKDKCICKIMFHDTPGLNEVNSEEDIQHMWSVLEKFSEEEYQTCLILCLEKNRIDSQTLLTLDYYSKLFKKLFLIGNVIILKTHLTEDDYIELIEEKSFEKYKEEFLKDLKIKLPICENINFFELINSKLLDIKRHTYLDFFNMIENNIIPKISDCYIHSFYVRQSIINYIVKCVSDKMDNDFPLPPMIELKRISELDALDRERKKEIETTQRYNSDHARLLRDYSDIEKRYSEKKKEIAILQQETIDLSSTIIHSKRIYSGVDWVKLMKEKGELISKYDYFDVPEYKWKTHNCSFNVYKKENKNVKFTISVYMLPILYEWKNNSSWFCDVWLESDGEIINKIDLTLKRAIKDEKEKNINDIMLLVNQAQKSLEVVRKNTSECEIKTFEIINKVTILLMEKYNRFTIKDLLKILNLKIDLESK